MGAFLDIVRPLNLKRATVIPVTNSVQLLATHLVVDWEGYLVGDVGPETSLCPPFLPTGWPRSLRRVRLVFVRTRGLSTVPMSHSEDATPSVTVGRCSCLTMYGKHMAEPAL